eukprot:4304214-Prymnesium_polylepis.1
MPCDDLGTAVKEGHGLDALLDLKRPRLAVGQLAFCSKHIERHTSLALILLVHQDDGNAL